MSLPELPPEPPAGWQPAPPDPQGWASQPSTGPDAVTGPLVCTLCGAPLLPAEPQRCVACGLHQQMGPTRANPFSETAALVTMFTALAVVYALTFLIVAMR